MSLGRPDRPGAGRPGEHQLAILPNTTHYSVFMAPTLVPAMETFLDA